LSSFISGFQTTIKVLPPNSIGLISLSYRMSMWYDSGMIALKTPGRGKIIFDRIRPIKYLCLEEDLEL